ncbi:hypothetical protein CYLTODRAFT_421452 [Cylindrobasidium torrendii FP15055 ss-10]|uniref:Uncharacterized protein n=1 Tax=Cylindrobasidium torrendii FP15055 ss-10 TaxID=1314674 RepID=A0A0D7BG43_9AGAR|nr:hypothetical protein CYLTODRAFT_421452 [Cylindrobasidium torrendii FP15055 ss-10]
MPSSSSSSSSSRSPSPAPQKTNKKTRVTIQEDGIRHEGQEKTWAYEPPQGSTLLDNPKDLGSFDWDALNKDKDLELWVVRVPEAIKAKHLEDVQVDLSTNKQQAHLGSLTRKKTVYDIWAVEDGVDTAGAEELKTMTCLLPRKSKKGEMYLAPRPIARRMVISANPSIPPLSSKPYTNPARPVHPQEALKHAFVPYGAGFSNPLDAENEDINMDPSPVEGSPKVSKKEKKDKEKSGKKRKGDETELEPAPKSPKKSKKNEVQRKFKDSS